MTMIFNKIKIGLLWKIFFWFWLTSLTIVTSLFIVLAVTTNPAELMYERKVLFQQLDKASYNIIMHKNRSIADVTPLFPENGYFLFDNYGNVISNSDLSVPVLNIYNKNRKSTVTDIFFEQGIVIVGPKCMMIDDIFVQLYLTKPAPSLLQWRITQLITNQWHLIIYAILISILFCFILASYLTRSITEIEKKVNQLSSGKFMPIPHKIANRKDEIGKLASAFNHMSKQLIANIASKENLLRYVSHELRSPLTRLQLATGIAFKKNQQNHELLNRVELEIKRMNYLIQQIMEFSRLKTHKKNLKKTVIHLDIWLKQLIQDCEFEAKHQDKNICLSIDESDIFINANSDLLASACENIIRNAIKHTLKGTIVTIIVNSTNDYVDIIIKDKGPGIPEHIIDKVFEPFITTSSNKQNVSGFGLGMCIAKEAIELHNGKILITNLVSGCQVILRLPV